MLTVKVHKPLPCGGRNHKIQKSLENMELSLNKRLDNYIISNVKHFVYHIHFLFVVFLGLNIPNTAFISALLWFCPLVQFALRDLD